MASRIINTILNLKDNFSGTIGKATSNTKQFQREMKLVENQAARIRNSVSGAFTSTGAKIAGAIGAVGITEFAKSSLELASNLAEVQNVVDTTFGNMSSQINDFAQNAQNKYGLAELPAKQYTSTLGAMFKSAGFANDQMVEMSTTLTGLVGDFASFRNLSTDEAFEKIRAGIAGQSEPLESVGIAANDTTVKMYAMANGFTGTWESASQATKEMYRYKVILSQMSDYQGDYAKTADSFANRVRNTKQTIQSFGASIMNYAIPSLSDFIGNINDFVKNINVKDVMENKVIPAITEMGKIIDTLKNNMKTIIPIVSGVVGGLVGFMVIGKVISEVKNFLKVINGIAKLTNPFYIIATGIGLLITGLVNAYNTSDDFRERVNNLFDKIMGFGDYAGNTLPGLLDSLTNVFTNDLQPALDKISDVSVGIFDFVSDNWNEIAPIATTIVGALGAYKLALMVIQFNTTLVTILTAGWSIITGIITTITTATSIWAGVQEVLNTAMKDNPVGFVITVIAALGLAIYEVVTHWQDICTWVGNTWNALKNNPIAEFIAACNPFTGLLFEIAKHFDAITNAIKGAWDWLTSWNGTKAEDKTATFNVTKNASSLDTSNADQPTFNPWQWKATGTQYSSGGPTIIGEHGPEAVNLPGGSKVYTASQTKRMTNGQSQVIINFNVSGNMIGEKEFFNRCGQHIFNQVQLGMINS